MLADVVHSRIGHSVLPYDRKRKASIEANATTCDLPDQPQSDQCCSLDRQELQLSGKTKNFNQAVVEGSDTSWVALISSLNAIAMFAQFCFATSAMVAPIYS